jgi:polysaccharide export outer membrane protein
MNGLILAVLLQAPPAPPPPVAAPPPAAPATTTAAGTPGRGYRIGAGDILKIAVYGHDDFNQTVVVQPDGNVVLPLVGAVPVAEATPRELEARIASRLAKGLIRNAQVSVLVEEYRSKVVYVMGEVGRPGTYPVAGDLRLVEILARAGPLSPNAGTEIVVVRPAGPVDRPVLPNEVGGASANGANGHGGGVDGARGQVLRVDVTDIEAGRLDNDLVLKPNDTVFVPQAKRIFVTGEVRNPGAFPFSGGLTVRQAVTLAGGFTEDASTGKVKVVRPVNGQPQQIKVKLDEPLRPGDTVLVKAKLF